MRALARGPTIAQPDFRFDISRLRTRGFWYIRESRAPPHPKQLREGRIRSMLELLQIQSSDLPAVRELFNQVFEVSPPQPLEYIVNLCHTEPESCLIGRVDGEPIGYACGHRSGRIGYIGTVAVAEPHRRKGYGRQLTTAVRDHLGLHCDVVGLSVEPNLGRNLELYASCDFEPSMPACMVWKQWTEEQTPTCPPTVHTALELGTQAAGTLQKLHGWMNEVFPGLDFRRDLDLFASKYPDRLWFHFEDGAPVGFLAYEPLFRGDVWGCVRPGPGEEAVLDSLVCAIESALPERHLWLHFHTTFQHILPTLRRRGYTVQSHKTNLVWSAQAGLWPLRSDAILIRPWWT